MLFSFLKNYYSWRSKRASGGLRSKRDTCPAWPQHQRPRPGPEAKSVAPCGTGSPGRYCSTRPTMKETSAYKHVVLWWWLGRLWMRGSYG
jgi:hypothetical protein